MATGQHNRTSEETQVTRRNFLASAPAAVALTAAPLAAEAATETPIAAMHRELTRLVAQMNDGSLPSAEGERLWRESVRIADGIVDLPSTGPMDFIFKMMAHTYNGEHDLGDCPRGEELWAEARALVGA